MGKMWQPKNLNETQLPLLILTWICGYGVTQQPLNNLRTLFSVIYFIFASSIYSTCFYFSYQYFFHIDWPNNEDKFFSIYIIVQCGFMGINLINGWIRRPTLMQVCERNTAVEKILEFLGISINLRQALKNSLLSAIFCCVFTIATNILTIIWFRQSIPILKGLSAIFILQHPIHVNGVIDMNFISSMRHIRLRLKSINEILSNFNDIKHDNWILKTNISSNNLSFSPRFLKRNTTGANLVSNSSSSISNVENIFQIIKYLHLEIKVLSKKVMSVYGVPLIITMITTFSMITCLFYALYLSMWSPEIFDPDRTFKSFIVIMSIIEYSIKLIQINYVCAQTVNEYRKTGDIVRQLNIQSYDLNMRNKILQFYIQLIHHPLVFSPCGLIQLGFPFIRDFVGSLTTYLIILIQINDSIPKSN